MPKQSIYNVGKFGVKAFTESLSLELEMSESSKLSSNTENKDYNTLSSDQNKDVQQVKGMHFFK